MRGEQELIEKTTLLLEIRLLQYLEFTLQKYEGSVNMPRPWVSDDLRREGQITDAVETIRNKRCQGHGPFDEQSCIQ